MLGYADRDRSVSAANPADQICGAQGCRLVPRLRPETRPERQGDLASEQQVFGLVAGQSRRPDTAQHCSPCGRLSIVADLAIDDKVG